MKTNRRKFLAAASVVGAGLTLGDDIVVPELHARGLLEEDRSDELEDHAAAVQHIETAKAIHEAWVELLEDPERLARRMPDADAKILAKTIGTAEYHRIWVHRYARVLSVLTKGRDF